MGQSLAKWLGFDKLSVNKLRVEHKVWSKQLLIGGYEATGTRQHHSQLTVLKVGGLSRDGGFLYTLSLLQYA